MEANPESFGTALRRRRAAAGMSLADLAKRVHYSKGYLSRVENGAKQPSPSLARHCDAALDAGGELLALVPRPRGAAPTAPPDPPARATAGPGSPAGSSGRGVRSARSDPAGWGARSSGPHPASWEVRSSQPDPTGRGVRSSRPDPAVRAVAGEQAPWTVFRGLLGDLRLLGQQSPPRLLLPALRGNLVTLHTLAGAARRADQSRLLLLAARYAEYIGWMYQEVGDEAATAYWTEQAVRDATAAGELELVAYALVRRANAALYRCDPTSTIELARAARADRHAGPRVRALAAQREAQGHALAGDHSGTMRCLDQARELFGAAATAPAGLVLGSSSVSDPSGLVHGWCLYDLGRAEQAAAVLVRELAAVPPASRRSRARFGARLALAQVEAGDPESGCRTAAAVLDDDARVGSATIRTDLRLLYRALARWRSRAAVHPVADRLAAALHQPA